MPALRALSLICAALLLGAEPALAGWQEEYKAGVEDILAGRVGMGVDKAYVAVIGPNAVPGPERAKAIVALCNLLFKGDLDDDAAKLLERALADDRDNGDTYYFCRGSLHERSWDFGQAVADYQASLKQNPDNVSSLLALGRLRLRCPEDKFVDRDQALALARRAQRASDNAGARAVSFMLEAQIHSERRDYDQAVACQEKAVAAAEGSLAPEQVAQIKSLLDLFKRRAKGAKFVD